MEKPYTPLPARRRLLMIKVAGAVSLLAACGVAVADGFSTRAGPAKNTAPMAGMNMPHQADAARAPVARNTVSIKGFAFAPAAVTVRAGTTVTWTNDDDEPHTVTAPNGPFRSSALGTGATFRYTFTKPGRYPYVCTIHPFMRGTVVVTR